MTRRGTSVARSLQSRIVPGVDDPVFIIGCGRSGTTILGKALYKHPAVVYLNERRDIWLSSYPEADIWRPDAASRGGKLVMTAADVRPAATRRMRRLFRLELLRRKRSTIVDKMPINNFRLPFLAEMFPAARYLHIHRNGLEVARSVARLCDEGGWFAENTYKWKLLSEHALGDADTAELPDRCQSYAEKGLVEWRLSTEAVADFARTIDPDRITELSYAELVDQPAATLCRVLGFLGLPYDPPTIAFAEKIVGRKSTQLTDEPSVKELALGGPLLRPSMTGRSQLVLDRD
jgi:Sulfotransferase family